MGVVVVVFGLIEELASLMEQALVSSKYEVAVQSWHVFLLVVNSEPNINAGVAHEHHDLNVLHFLE